MIARAIVAALLLCASSAQAISTSTGMLTTGTASRARVAPLQVPQQAQPKPPTPAPATGGCFWQAPGTQQWVNLWALQGFKLKETGTTYPRGQPGTVTYSVLLIFGRSDWLEVPLMPGSDPNEVPRAILAHLERCAGR